MNYIRDCEYLQMVARREWADDLLFKATMTEETEEEFAARCARMNAKHTERNQ